VSATDEELAKLRADAVGRDHLIWTAYFFSHFFSEWHERQAFREALRDGGFTGIGTDEEVTGDRYYHHWSHTIRPADPEILRTADGKAAAIAEAHGVRYDEWMVLRNLKTGELRPASDADAERLRAQDEHSFAVARRAAQGR